MIESNRSLQELSKELGKFNSVKTLFSKGSSSETFRRPDLEVLFDPPHSPQERQRMLGIRMMWMYQALTGKTLDEEQVEVIQESIEKSQASPNYTCAMRTGFGKTELQLLFAAKDLCEDKEQGLCFSTNESNLQSLKDRATPLALRLGKEPIELRLHEGRAEEVLRLLENPGDKIFFLSNDDLCIAKLRAEGPQDADLWRQVFQKLCKMKHSLDEIVAQTEGTVCEDQQLHQKILQVGLSYNLEKVPSLRYEVFSALQGGKISFSATASQLQGRSWNQDGSEELSSMKVDALSYGRVFWTLSHAEKKDIPEDLLAVREIEDLKAVLDVGTNPFFNPADLKFQSIDSYNQEKKRLAAMLYRKGSLRELRTQLKDGNGQFRDHFFDGSNWFAVDEENKKNNLVTRYLSLDEAVGSDFPELNDNSGMVAVVLKGGVPATADLIQYMGRMRKMLEGQRCLCYSEHSSPDSFQTALCLMQEANEKQENLYPEKLMQVISRDVPNAFAKILSMARNRIDFAEDEQEEEQDTLELNQRQMQALVDAWEERKRNPAAGDFRDKFKAAVDTKAVPKDLLESIMRAIQNKSESDISEFFASSPFGDQDILLRAKMRSLSDEIKRIRHPKKGADPLKDFFVSLNSILTSREGRNLQKYLEWLAAQSAEHSITICEEQYASWEERIKSEAKKIRFPTKTGVGRSFEPKDLQRIAEELLQLAVFPKTA